MELVRGEGGSGTLAVGDLRSDLEQVDGWIYLKPNPPLLRALVGATGRGVAGRALAEGSRGARAAGAAGLADGAAVGAAGDAVLPAGR